MCELLAKSSRQATTVNLSLSEFAQHGGRTGPHRDGWGIAYYEDSDIRLIKDTKQASQSPWERFVEDQGLRTRTAISHIRNATTGHVAITNTHPFVRELGGRMHVFAHNGVVDGVLGEDGLSLGRFGPLGDTDSEHAFCAMLEDLTELWSAGEAPPPPLEDRLDVIEAFAAKLRGFGPANFLYADGETLFAHSHERHQDDGTRRPPGLHLLQRNCVADGDAIQGGGVTIAADGDGQSVALLASVPLTAEPWLALDPGTLLAIEAGDVVTSRG
ncbi:MAG: class II glutamine amidotransferase [Alphaproteobacteria bacterium]|jgi:predicted glutamine amidotransferase|nr:class II glutamine amidotransferase [Rhodospirillaceae bacterium]MBT6511627.1 class II glutamine amidotransferase [Rhodospirillaceae bacterium]MBT7612740.1 class II glutamine amidotransferase [Rhodospirillaceae bacterium]MBT7646463.1 class II glutamine amidotransferase [Rhodospirillaceae bacterium]MDG2481692.1 class II glutamine amidotransferase [Alphaproteobacteria bacterium]